MPSEQTDTFLLKGSYTLNSRTCAESEVFDTAQRELLSRADVSGQVGLSAGVMSTNFFEVGPRLRLSLPLPGKVSAKRLAERQAEQIKREYLQSFKDKSEREEERLVVAKSSTEMLDQIKDLLEKFQAKLPDGPFRKLISEKIRIAELDQSASVREVREITGSSQSDAEKVCRLPSNTLPSELEKVIVDIEREFNRLENFTEIRSRPWYRRIIPHKIEINLSINTFARPTPLLPLSTISPSWLRAGRINWRQQAQVLEMSVTAIAESRFAAEDLLFQSLADLRYRKPALSLLLKSLTELSTSDVENPRDLSRVIDRLLEIQKIATKAELITQRWGLESNDLAKLEFFSDVEMRVLARNTVNSRFTTRLGESQTLCRRVVEDLRKHPMDKDGFSQTVATLEAFQQFPNGVEENSLAEGLRRISSVTPSVQGKIDSGIYVSVSNSPWIKNSSSPFSAVMDQSRPTMSVEQMLTIDLRSSKTRDLKSKGNILRQQLYLSEAKMIEEIAAASRSERSLQHKLLPKVGRALREANTEATGSLSIALLQDQLLDIKRLQFADSSARTLTEHKLKSSDPRAYYGEIETALNRFRLALVERELVRREGNRLSFNSMWQRDRSSNYAVGYMDLAEVAVRPISRAINKLFSKKVHKADNESLEDTLRIAIKGHESRVSYLTKKRKESPRLIAANRVVAETLLQAIGKYYEVEMARESGHALTLRATELEEAKLQEIAQMERQGGETAILKSELSVITFQRNLMNLEAQRYEDLFQAWEGYIDGFQSATNITAEEKMLRDALYSVREKTYAVGSSIEQRLQEVRQLSFRSEYERTRTKALSSIGPFLAGVRSQESMNLNRYGVFGSLSLGFFKNRELELLQDIVTADREVSRTAIDTRIVRSDAQIESESILGYARDIEQFKAELSENQQYLRGERPNSQALQFIERQIRRLDLLQIEADGRAERIFRAVGLVSSNFLPAFFGAPVWITKVHDVDRFATIVSHVLNPDVSVSRQNNSGASLKQIDLQAFAGLKSQGLALYGGKIEFGTEARRVAAGQSFIAEQELLNVNRRREFYRLRERIKGYVSTLVQGSESLERSQYVVENSRAVLNDELQAVVRNQPLGKKLSSAIDIHLGALKDYYESRARLEKASYSLWNYSVLLNNDEKMATNLSGEWSQPFLPSIAALPARQ